MHTCMKVNKGCLEGQKLLTQRLENLSSILQPMMERKNQLLKILLGSSHTFLGTPVPRSIHILKNINPYIQHKKAKLKYMQIHFKGPQFKKV